MKKIGKGSVMGNWQEGVYNSNYILHKKGLVSQLKYECILQPARLDEVSIERYDNGDKCVVFTTDPDATNDSKQGGVHARLAYNGLFKDLNHIFAQSSCIFSTDNEEVHCIRGRRGDERLLVQAILRLEEYDNSLSEISYNLKKELGAKPIRPDEIKRAIELQKERLNLLETVLAKESQPQSARAKASAKVSRKSRSKAKISRSVKHGRKSIRRKVS